MTAERNFVDVNEMRAQVEHLLSYYRAFGEEEFAVVTWLEVRLIGLSEQESRAKSAPALEAR